MAQPQPHGTGVVSPRPPPHPPPRKPRPRGSRPRLLPGTPPPIAIRHHTKGALSPAHIPPALPRRPGTVPAAPSAVPALGEPRGGGRGRALCPRPGVGARGTPLMFRRAPASRRCPGSSGFISLSPSCDNDFGFVTERRSGLPPPRTPNPASRAHPVQYQPQHGVGEFLLLLLLFCAASN